MSINKAELSPGDSLDKLADKFHAIMVGASLKDVLGVCLSGACVAAKGLKIPKPMAMAMLSAMWDDAGSVRGSKKWI